MSTGAPPDKVEVEITNPRIADKGGHTEYECTWIMTQVLPGTLTPTTMKWTVFRRYKEFAVVEQALRKQYGSAVSKLIFPPKQHLFPYQLENVLRLKLQLPIPQFFQEFDKSCFLILQLS